MIRIATWWLALVLVLFAAPVHAGPAIDPRQMSGMPRVDPQVPAGAITVRVLDGGFDKPATNVEVTLALTKPDGSKDTKTATTDLQGRATFSGLEAAIGGTAIATATVGTETMTSQPIPLSDAAGSRVMLVTGAGAGAAAGAAAPANPHGGGGGPEVPESGVPFALDGTPAGRLVVGTFDLTERKPIAKIEITVEIVAPDGTRTEKKGTTDESGRAEFNGLVAPAIAAGSKITVKGTLPGNLARVSKTFEMDAKVGQAVLLTLGELPARPASNKRPELPGPRVMPSLPQGTVRVRVVDPNDAPVADQAVDVIKREPGGAETRFPGTTKADGTVDVVVDVASDAFYQVGVVYDRGPYTSGFFQVDKRGGVGVDLRVFPTTSDYSVLRSVVSFEVDGLENDLARVLQLHDVMVMGDKAFWPQGGLKLEPARGAKNVSVPPFGGSFLEHDDNAPYATLTEPLPPGALVRMALVYALEHDGTAAIDFVVPFDVVESSVAVGDDQTLDAAGAKLTEHESPTPGKAIYTLGARARGAKIQFAIGGLPVRDPLLRRIALFGAIAVACAAAVAMMMRPRVDRRTALVARRDELLAMLDAIPSSQGARRERVIAALDRVWRQIDALGGAAASPPRTRAPAKAEPPTGA